MAIGNRIVNVAVVGATGNLGGTFTKHLLHAGNHKITALTRTGGKNQFPEGVKVIEVDYTNETSLASALQGQDFLIITLHRTAPANTHSNIVKAAVKAGIPYIMPNAYGMDLANKALRDEDTYSGAAFQRCEEVADLGSSYIAFCCSFWYEWCLIGSEWHFGFDLKKKRVTFYDDGQTCINVSTFEQCGRALAALLNLPESGASPSISDWKNRNLYISSFRVSQRDMLDSLNRVLGTTDQDWTISYQTTADRYREGLDEIQRGVWTGPLKAMFSRVFFPNGDGDYESKRGLANAALGLPKEDLDEATRNAVKIVESGFNPLTA